MTTTHITQERLKELLHYNQETGLFTWRKRQTDRYSYIAVDGKRYQAHRLAWFYMTGEWPVEIDHDDRDKSNNAWDNLNNGTRAENMSNLPLRRDNKSGIHGVHFIKREGRKNIWWAKIGRDTSLYRGDDFFEAVCARKSAENKLGYHVNHGR